MIVDNREEWRVKYDRHMALKNCKHKDWRYTSGGLKVCKFCKEIVGCYKPPCTCGESIF